MPSNLGISFYADFALFVRAKLKEFGKAGDVSAVFSLAHDLVGLVEVYDRKLSWTELADPLKRLRIAARELRAKWEAKL